MNVRNHARTGRALLFVLALVALCALVTGASGAVISMDTNPIAIDGNTVDAFVMVDALPNGCAGFKLDVIFTTPGIAEVNFVEFQSPAVITSFTKTDANTATISGAFQNTVYPAGSTDAWLAKLTIRGNGVGSTPLTIANVAIDDLGGYAIANTTTGATVNVATASPLAPVVDFTANVTSGPAPLAVKFTDTSLNGPFTTRKWEFGTGTPVTTLSATTPTKVYTTPGNYTVKLTLTNDGGIGVKVKEAYINVTEPVAAPPPVAAFTANRTSGVAPLAVLFTDSSTNSPTSWSWNFGDTQTSTSQNPVHTYSAAGTYTVTLTATNAAGSDPEVKTNYITVTAAPVAPVAAFTANRTSGVAPLAVLFTDSSTNSPTSWSWNFGDTQTSTSQNPVHTYSAAGTYTVTLTATNAAGSDPEVKTNYITVTAAPVAPVAAFTANRTSGVAPLAVLFTDSSTNSPTSWSWNFGDTQTSTSRNPVHTYSAAGTYTVTLTATNAAGSDPEVKTNYITVTAAPVAPVADFTANRTSGTAPLAVLFTDSSTNSPTSWSWNFGDTPDIDLAEPGPHLQRGRNLYGDADGDERRRLGSRGQDELHHRHRAPVVTPIGGLQREHHGRVSLRSPSSSWMPRPATTSPPGRGPSATAQTST